MTQTKIFGWNVRGLNHPKRQREVTDWLRTSGTQLGALIETHVTEEKTSCIMQRIAPSWRIDTNNSPTATGRIWLLWDPSLSVMVYSKSDQKLICGVHNSNTGEQFTLIVVYASNRVEDRTGLWQEITTLSQDTRLVNQPWIVLGDFNQILNSSEHFSSTSNYYPSQGNREFQQCLTSSNLFDLAFSGMQFTWTSRRAGNPLTRKLDRVLVTDIWLLKFPLSHVVFETAGGSDHVRYVVYMGTEDAKPKIPFKYLSFTSSLDNFQERIKECWSSTTTQGSKMFQFIQKRKTIKSICVELCKGNFQNIQTQTRLAKERLSELQSELFRHPTSQLFQQEVIAHKKWNYLASIEERFYSQKSRIKWLKEGDLNTNFFHRAVLTRQATNRIRSLVNSNGIRTTETIVMKNMVLEYYTNLLGTANENVLVRSVGELKSLLTFRCSEGLKGSLKQIPSMSEIKDVVFSLPRRKAPGPDGFPIEFYIDTWNTTGTELMAATSDFFINNVFLRQINSTAITLIPKIKGADKLGDFRPISCCNVTYKIISTILSRKLKLFLSDAVQQNQAGFVKGRLLAENILLASELISGFHKTNPTSRGCLKVDLAKAYDSVSWEFIRNILRAIDLPSQLIQWIMICITTPTYSVNYNGELTGFFHGKKGLRQGDPLSSSLFVLAMDVLSKKLDVAARENKFRLHPSCRRPLVTHLSFADDLLVFFDGTLESLQGILDVFDNFYLNSGLRLNCQKTVLFMDGNDSDLLISAAAQAGITAGTLPVKYLGLPLSPTALKPSDYQVLIDKLQQRLLSWKVKHLSFAGRLQLISSVLNSMINFWLSIFILPKKCILKVEALCRSFLWKGDNTSSKGAKVSWDAICTPKKEGGLGLKRLMKWNSVLGLKLIWLMFSTSGSLWVAWARTHLLKQGCLWTSSFLNKGSSHWKRIMKLRPLAATFISSRVGSGNSVSFWHDRWLPQGSLIALIGETGPLTTGIRSQATVRQAVSNGDWTLSASNRNPTITLLRRTLPPTPPALDEDAQDSYYWSTSPTCTSSRFSTRQTWLSLNPPLAMVPWHKIVWLKIGIPKHSFIIWLAVLGRLATSDRMRAWGINVPTHCLLCQLVEETLDHLLVACPFVQVLWSRFLPLSTQPPVSTFVGKIAWAVARQAPRDILILERLLFQSIIYETWAERNGRLHQRQESTAANIVQKITRTIRSKLHSVTSTTPTRSRQSVELLMLWFRHFQPPPLTAPSLSAPPNVAAATT